MREYSNFILPRFVFFGCAPPLVAYQVFRADMTSQLCCVILTIMLKVAQDSAEASTETAATSQPSRRGFLVDNPSLQIATVK